MAKNLSIQCSKLRISDEENEIVDLGDVISPEVDDQVSLMLVGCLVTDRPFNLDAFKKTMVMAWAVSKKVVIQAVAANLFVIHFFHWRDKEKVMEGRPWCFDQHLLVLNELSGDEQPTKIPLNLSPFWVRIYHLPFNCRSDNDVRAITVALGLVLSIEPDALGLNKYRRVKVLLDVNKPLRRIQKIKGKNGTTLTIEFKYERLPYFCFKCGVMGHGEKDCPSALDDPQDGNFGWGLWLKASPRKGRSRYLEEEA
ncbi:uncharacterized protein LOC104890894 [Beta vulgaris subsp. vulgaris]|uniref:uncharacterized protein LOC104890894 n=1 Tax=Beta vulgaris subsp. vulgaris TaxID=3555 RepID=UPI00053FBF45|nr:uncharacterized protein LOC104890894 [Beta vulgaris subsp. vulgaris]